MTGEGKKIFVQNAFIQIQGTYSLFLFVPVKSEVVFPTPN